MPGVLLAELTEGQSSGQGLSTLRLAQKNRKKIQRLEASISAKASHAVEQDYPGDRPHPPFLVEELGDEGRGHSQEQDEETAKSYAAGVDGVGIAEADKMF